MSIVDIVIIALIVMFIVIGVWKGVQRSALGFGAFFIAALIAFFLAKPVTEALLNAGGIDKFVFGRDGFSLYNWIKNGIQNFGDEETAVELDALTRFINAQPDFLRSHFFNPILERAVSGYSGYILDQFTQLDGFSLYCAFLMFSAIVGIGVFVIIRLLLCIPTMIIKSYFYGKKTSTVRVFGGIVGAVTGFFVSLVITVVFTTMGGLTFVRGFNKIDSEYEQSVIAKTFYSWGYGIRNSMYLPDAEMYARIIEKSGMTVDEGEAPPDQSMYGDRMDIYIYLQNLNYISGTPYGYDEITGNLTYDENTGVKINPDTYAGTGLDEVFRAIMAYNEQAAASIGQGALDDKDSGTLRRYKSALWEGTTSVYTVLVQQSLFTDAQNYALKISEFSASIEEDNVDEATLAEFNRQLGVLYDKIVSELNSIKALYGELSPAFGTLEFDIPDVVVLPIEPIVED